MPNINVDYFVVGGGGGGTGGANGGSPGGAGGVRAGTLNLPQGAIYYVTIGTGGTGTTGVSAASGNTSTFGTSTYITIAASGGGGGTISAYGKSGGSGAGAPASSVSYQGGQGNTGTYLPVEGYAGGNNNITSPYPAGGGGGASAAGGNGTGSQSGRGGTGTFTTLISTTDAILFGIGQYVTATNATYFAGGGGGGGTVQTAIFGQGGTGGGGNGGALGPGYGGTATNYTGGGGGGGGNNAGTYGGTGASGVVILRYITTSSVAVKTTADLTTSSGIYTTYVFTASGTISFISGATIGTNLDLLMVGGGGGGGTTMGGGGGAGGVNTTTNRYFDPGSYIVTVGAGGLGSPPALNASNGPLRGSNGGDSSIINTATTASYSVVLQSSQSLSVSTSSITGVLSFTGTNYLTMGLGAFVLGASDFTVEAWVYPTASTTLTVFSNTGDGTAANSSLICYINGATASSAYIAAVATSVTSPVCPLNQWSHVAWVRYGATFRSYLNGAIYNSIAISGTLNAGASYPPSIGASSAATPLNYFKGYMAAVRIVIGTALYTGSYGNLTATLPLTTVTNTALLLNGSTSTPFSDLSTSTRLVASPRSVAFNSSSPFTGSGVGGSLAFNNSTYMIVPGATHQPQGTEDFTLEFWVKFAHIAYGNFPRIYQAGGATPISVNFSGAQIQTNFGVFNIDSTYVGRWIHFALVRSYPNGYFYFDGVVRAANTNYITSLTPGTQSQIFQPEGGGPVAQMTNFRIVRGTAVYPGGAVSSTITVPTSPLTAISSTTLLLSVSNITSATFDSSTLTNVLTFAGSASSAYDPVLYLNTSGPAVSFPTASDFTIEGWVYRLAYGDLSMWNQGATFGLTINPGTGINAYLNTGTANLVVTDLKPAVQTWNHIALVRSNGIVSVYLNGIASATTASNTSILGNITSFNVGGQPNGTGVWVGAPQYISNFRVINGTALYTGSFALSAFPLTTVTNTTLLLCSSSSVSIGYSTATDLILISNTGTNKAPPVTSGWNPFNALNIAAGGGGGASDYVVNTSFGSFGGSGGGVAGSASVTQGLGINGQGFAGGQTTGNYWPGGGGGAGGNGTTGTTSVKGSGGPGIPSSILGNTYYWGGGGGGAGYTFDAGNGGIGGGGGGAPKINTGGFGGLLGVTTGTDGVNGTLAAVTNAAGGNGGYGTGGGGGGGSHQFINNPGGNGGSGAVVIRYTGPQKATGGSVFSYTTGTTLYTAHAFFSSGVFTLYPSPLNIQQTGGIGGPYGGGGGGASTFYINTPGGLGAPGTLLSSGYSSLSGGGAGGGASTTSASGGGGGIDVYGVTGINSTGGAIDNPGTAGSTYWYNIGGQPGISGNGGLYGGGGAGAAVSSVDTNTGNGAGGALLIVYNTTASTYLYPNLMPVVFNGISTASSTLLVSSTTTGRLLLTQYDNVATSYQGLNYQSLTTGKLVNYGNTDFVATKESQSQSVLAGNLQLITYISDHEMMLKNSDPYLPATYNTPGNYQFIQEITPANDPRLVTVRIQNYIVGVTGSDSSLSAGSQGATGGQVWY